MQASLLDILFDNRNKDYGAYALRKGYNLRLLTALGAGIFVVLVFASIELVKKQDKTIAGPFVEPGIVIRQYTIPEVRIKQPEAAQASTKQKRMEKTAEASFSSQPKITDNITPKASMTPVENLPDKIPGSENSNGLPAGEKTKVTGPATTAASADQPGLPVKGIEPQETGPLYPGGPDALSEFLRKNLNIPADLEAGEKKMVKIRFKVDVDGTVNSFEIVSSGGSEFDNEVIRVCRKMPRWKPAFQNGVNVPVSYILPVTFIGLE